MLVKWIRQELGAESTLLVKYLIIKFTCVTFLTSTFFYRSTCALRGKIDNIDKAKTDWLTFLED